MAMPIQRFEKKAIKEVKYPSLSSQEFTQPIIPQIQEFLSIAGVVPGLSLDATRNLSVVRKISGSIAKKYMKETTRPSETGLSARLTAFGSGVPNIDIEFRDRTTGKTLAVVETDSNGYARYTVKYGSPGLQKQLEAGIYPISPATEMIPGMSSTKLFSLWTILTKTRNLTDVWARFQGRAIGHKLDRTFHHTQPHTVIGLAGWIDFIELVPVLEGQSIRYEIGIPAWCNTPEARPTAEKCEEYRKNTWWKAGLYASNTERAPTLVAENKINLDYHLVYEITASHVRFVERRYIGK